ncbi:MAG: hypothetical protein ABI863_04265 [Ginsengibacter sp.]
MKKQLSILTMSFLFFSLTILAQDANKVTTKKFKVGLGLDAALPVGSLSQVYSVGGGLSLRFLYKITPQFGATFTTGFIAFIPKDVNHINDNSKATLNIPFKLGGRYMFTDKFYGIMEVGITHSITYFKDTNGDLAHVSGNSFTYAPGIGLLLGGFDVSLRYEGYSHAGFMGLRLGFFF